MPDKVIIIMNTNKGRFDLGLGVSLYYLKHLFSTSMQEYSTNII